MELNEFVSQTIIQITEGINEARDKTDAKICPHISGYGATAHKSIVGVIPSTKQPKQIVHMIDFDVAITISKGKQKGGKIGVHGGVVGLGGKLDSTSLNESLSRIKFSIPIAYPELEE